MARSRRRRRDLPPDRELDLHGLRGEQAVRRLAQELHAWRVQGVRRALVITGRGMKSEAGPVLAPLVRTWLDGGEARSLGVKKWKDTHKGGALELTLGWPSDSPRDGSDGHAGNEADLDGDLR